MMTSLEESRGNELVEIVDGFAKRFGTFRSVFVSAVWADLRAQHASMSTLLPRSAWTVAFLRTANTMLALNEFMAKEMRQVALRDLHTAELEMVLLHFAPLFSVYEQYFEAKKPFAELVRVERQKTPSLESLIAETEVRVGCKFDEMLDLPLLQIIALRGCINKRLGRHVHDAAEAAAAAAAAAVAGGRVSGPGALEHLVPVAEFLENAQTRINEIEARHASEALIVQIAAAWDVGNHVFAIKRPGRLIVKEGTLIKVSRKKEVAYQFVLFNDALMYGSRGGVMSRKRFKMHNALDLVSVQIGIISVGDTALELDDLSTVAPDGAVGGAVLSMLSSLSEQERGQLRFNIYSGGGGKSFCVKAKSPGELCEWWLTLSRTATKYKQRQAQHAARFVSAGPDAANGARLEANRDLHDVLSPVWQPDKASSACTLCDAPFTTLRRRHHCYACGRLLCGSCSRFRGLRQVSALAKDSSLRRLLKKQGSTGLSDRAQEKLTLERTVRMCEGCSIKSTKTIASASDEANKEQTRTLPSSISAATSKEETGTLSSETMQNYVNVEDENTLAGGSAMGQDSTEEVKPPNEVQVDPALRVALDILQSEVSYLEGLRTLTKVYVRPLLDDFRADARLIGGEVVGIVKQADLSSMFVFLSDIQYIAALSERLLVALREQCFYFDSSGAASGLRGSIADIFLQMSPLFQLYDEYSSSFEFANRTLTEKMHAFQTLREFFDCQERENETQLRAVGAQCMQSLLILPIQRLPRYLLLLERLRKNTDPDCAEFARLQSAVDAIQAMTCHINERIREREGLVKMHDFVRCWGNVVIRDAPVDRRCLREGSLVKQSRKGFKKYDFVLFTDALMYGERDEFLQRVRHHRTMLIAYCQVREAEDDSCAFELVGREKSFRVRAVDATVCAEWVSDLRRAIATVRERQKGIESETAPVWVKDTAQCMRCEAPFSLVSRPHHCRRCGKCLCNDCTPNRWLLEHIDPHKPQRVCLDCYGNLFAAYGPPALPAAQSKEVRVTSPLGVMAQLRSSPLTQEQKE